MASPNESNKKVKDYVDLDNLTFFDELSKDFRAVPMEKMLPKIDSPNYSKFDAILERIREKLMPTMTTKNGKAATEKKEPRKVEFQFEGDRIVIPKDMDYDEAIEALVKQRDEDNVYVSISEPINAFPLDGAAALMYVLKERYGWTNLVPTMGFWGPNPPVMIGVETGYEKRIQVPWGNMTVPKIDGNLSTGYEFKNGMPMFTLSGEVKRMHERIVADIANAVREHVKQNSIYRGQAIKMNFRDSDGSKVEFDESLCPRFIDLSTSINCDPIFSQYIEDSIRVNIMNPIQFSDRCRRKGASLKKGIMLGGPYGTGKTLTAFQIARLAVQHGWTFLYLEDVRDLGEALGFARLYQPCIVFAEDCDKATSGQRTSEMDRLLNVIDGVESKGDNAIITILTTNNMGIINPAFLRPGRIDAVIEVLPPDEHACLRIMKKYVSEGGCVANGSDGEFIAALKPLIGANAAFFRTTVEQAKLSAIGNMQSDDDDITIRPKDIAAVAEGMVPQAKLLNPNHGEKSLLELEDSDESPMEAAFDTIMQGATQRLIENIADPKTLKDIKMREIRKQNRRSKRKGVPKG